MPFTLIRKIYKSGNSFHITIPILWLKAKEAETGKFPEELKMTINSDIVIDVAERHKKR